jgi:RNA polymerase sigma factor (sigma-70 family)
VEASALQAPAALTRSRLSIGLPLLRLRSDDQLVALFRAGNEEAFRVIHERYHRRLFAYARQMLPGPRQDAEDALQDIFVRAYSGLRSSNRQLALRAWLYRVAHNRCVDELRRPAPPAPELMEIVRPPIHDPIAEAELRESLRRLVADVRRLPEHQRSALLMRELGGMAYADLAAALDVSVPAVKSLLVRARIGLAHAMEARDTACHEIREELSTAYDRGVRPSGLAKRHMHDCVGCRNFRVQIRGTSRQLAALVPIGPLAMITNLFGFGGGAAGGGAAGGGGAAAAGGVAGTGAVASIGAVAGGAATHVATILAAAVVTAGGAVEIQGSVSSASHRVPHHVAAGATVDSVVPSEAGSGSTGQSAASSPAGQSATASPSTPSRTKASPAAAAADSTAGPPIPSVDQLNPAANAGGANTSAAAGSTSAGGTNTGLPSDPSGTGAGTGQPGGGGTGSGEGTYAGMGTSLPGTGTSTPGTGVGTGTGSTGGTVTGSSNAPAPSGGTSSAGSTSSTTNGTAVPVHGPITPAAHLATPATAAIPAFASRTVGPRSRSIKSRSQRRHRHR